MFRIKKQTRKNVADTIFNDTVPWTYIVSDLNRKRFTKDKSEFRVEKVIKINGDKLYVKWKGYDNLFNSWINKKRHGINA